MEHPALVRVVDMDPTSAQARDFARAGNVSSTQQQSPTRTAASLSGLIDADLLAALDLSDDVTFSEAVKGDKGRDFRRVLFEALPASTRPTYFTDEQRLTDAGVELVQNMLLSRVLPVDTIEKLGTARPRMKQVIEGALPQLLGIMRDYPEGDITPQLIEALDFLARYPELRKPKELEAVLGQQSIFGGQDETLSPSAQMMTDFLLRDGDKPRVFRERFAKAISDIAYSQGLFGDERTPMQIVVDALEVKPREGAVFGRENQPMTAATTRRTSTGERVKVSEAVRVIERITSRLSRGKNFKVLRNMGEAPEDVKRALWSMLQSVDVKDRKHLVAGFYHRGTAYFVAKDLAELAAQEGVSVQTMAVAKWAHEYGLHYGLRGMMEELHGPGGKARVKALLANVYRSVGRDEILSAIGDGYGDSSPAILAEEYLAHLAERLNKKGDLTKPERGIWQRVLDFFRNAMRRFTGKMTDADVEKVVLSALKWARQPNESQSAGQGAPRFSLAPQYQGDLFDDYGPTPPRNDAALVARGIGPAQRSAARVLDAGGTVMDAWRAARRAAQEAIPGSDVGEHRNLAGDKGLRHAADARGIDTHGLVFSGWNAKRPARPDEISHFQGGEAVGWDDARFSLVKAAARKQTRTPQFKRWFANSKAVDENGEPLMLFHGTVNNFTRFKPGRANIESDWGKGYYFSNEPDDIENNYAAEGPDLTNKIERLAERIQAEADDELDYEDAKEQARRQLSQGRPNVMPAFLSMQNPFEVGGRNPEYWETEYDPEDEYAEPTGRAMDFLEALRQASFGYNDVDLDRLLNDLSDYIYEGGRADELVDRARRSEGLAYATDDEGDSATHEIVREALQRMGYDGIVDRTVYQKFGDERRMGRPMGGMYQSTVHYVAFESSQIKSATGNSGAFDPERDDIRFSADSRSGDPNAAPEAARRIEAGELATEPGKRGLANPLPDIDRLRQVYDTVQQVMDDLGLPGVKKVRDTYAAAEQMNLALVRERMMEHAKNGRTFETVEEAAAARLVMEREAPRLLKEGKHRELADLIAAYNDTGTEAARILAIRREQLELDGAEQKRAAILGHIFEPSRRLKAERDKINRDLSTEKNPGKRAVLLRRRGALNKEIAKEIETAKKILGKYNIDPEKIHETKPAVLRRAMRDIAASKHTLWDALFEWRMNWGLLSGGRSFVVDPLSTGMHAAWDATGEKFTGALVNLFAGDPLAPHMNELVTQWRGLVPGLVAGWRNALHTLATEEPILAASKGQKDLTETFKDKHDVAVSGRKGYLVRLPSTVKAASDEFIKSVVAHMDVWAEADRLARLEKLTGARRTRRIAELVGDGKSLAWTLALQHANYIAFQEPLKSTAGNKLMGTVHGTPLRWIFPFVKTPANLVKLGLRKSPLGVLSLVRERKRLSTAEKVTRTAEQLVAWGMAASLWAAMQGDDDEPWITGTSAWTPEEKNKREAEYRFAPPYTIDLPGYGRVDYSRLEPFSTALVTMVDGLDNFRRHGGTVERANEFMHDSVGLLKDKLFLRGASDLLDLIMDENKRPKVAADFLSSFVPNLYQQAALASDPTVRETQDAGHGRFGERVKYNLFPTSHVPYPKVDVWGQEIAKGGSGLWRATMPMNLYPNRPSELARNLDAMIRRYNEAAGREEPWWPSRPAGYYTVKGETRYWTDEQYHRLSVLAGKYALDKLKRQRLHYDAPRAQDIERVKKALEDARERARREVLRARG